MLLAAVERTREVETQLLVMNGDLEGRRVKKREREEHGDRDKSRQVTWPAGHYKWSFRDRSYENQIITCFVCEGTGRKR